jgi:hypothetical protein
VGDFEYNIRSTLLCVKKSLNTSFIHACEGFPSGHFIRASERHSSEEYFSEVLHDTLHAPVGAVT